jgi:hypothetical protein
MPRAVLLLTLLPGTLMAQSDPLSRIGTPCGVARESEYDLGSKPLVSIERLRYLNQAGGWQVEYEGDRATVHYICNSGAVVTALIFMNFQTHSAATTAHARHRARIKNVWGAPCWDAQALDDRQRAHLENSGETLTRHWREYVHWNVGSGSVMDIRQPSLNANGQTWSVAISIRSKDMPTQLSKPDVGVQLYRMSSCPRTSYMLPPNNALERAVNDKVPEVEPSQPAAQRGR